MFKVCWKNTFDSVNKYINYVLKNRLNTFNDLFSINVVDKPVSITIDEFFKITFSVVNKTSSKIKYSKYHL